METPGTPGGHETSAAPPNTGEKRKREDQLQDPDPRTFQGILLEPDEQLDKSNAKLKLKAYLYAMASLNWTKFDYTYVGAAQIDG